ncbi:MAG: SMP-30/gluconolactonase/LRE family protein [Rhodospirillales bacterium]
MPAGPEAKPGEPLCVWPAAALLGEGAVWDERDRAVYWVDIKAPAVHRYTPGTGDKRSWKVPEIIGCIARRRGGGFVAAFKSGFVFLDLETGAIERIDNPEPGFPGNRFNDGNCDPSGRFWAGSMDDDLKRPTGWLYRLDAERRWTKTDGGYICTNGPAFTGDGRTMYHTDTLGRVVHAFDLDAHGLPTRKRPHIRFAEDDGFPDGMTVDAEGRLWVAHWGGWRVTRFRNDGTAEFAIRLPVAQVTRPAFGGPGLTTLFVTSASIGLTAEERAQQPLAGGLFACETGVRGLPGRQFAG